MTLQVLKVKKISLNGYFRGSIEILDSKSVIASLKGIDWLCQVLERHGFPALDDSNQAVASASAGDLNH
jgi:hypothetical protein